MGELIPHAIKGTVFVLMMVVGLDCTLIDLKRSLRRVGIVSLVTVAQFTLIPAVTFGVCRVLDLPGELSAGLLLLSCCPSGTISNSYTFLARGNTALSVTLTTISCLVAAGATPGALWLTSRVAGASLDRSLAIPPGPLIEQLALMLALPIVLGLWARQRFPAAVTQNLGRLRLVSLVLLIALIVLIVGSAPEGEFGAQVEALLVPALLLTALLLLAAQLLGRLGKLPREDRTAVMFDFPCQNLAVVALVGVSVLERPDLVVFAVACFVVQAAALLVVAGLTASRSSRAAAE